MQICFRDGNSEIHGGSGYAFGALQAAGGRRATRSHALHVAVLLSRHSAAKVERAAEPRRDLRENCQSAVGRSQETDQVHELPEESRRRVLRPGQTTLSSGKCVK